MAGQSNETLISAFPPRIGMPLNGDSAKYVTRLARFDRPRLFIVGGYEFIFPLGTEGLRLYGGATLAEHRYVGWGFLAVQTTHRDAARLDLSGVFPGKTGSTNMRALRYLLTAPDPKDYKRLELPGIFPQAQKVVLDNYDFTRVDGDPWGWNYNFTVVRVGLGNTVDMSAASSDPTPNAQTRGTGRTFTVRVGAQTLKSISSVVYSDADQWRQLYVLNQYTIEKALSPDFNFPMEQIPMTLLPLGLQISY